MSDPPISEISFEDAIRELKDVVNQLERGDAALIESIELYQRGSVLIKRCREELTRAEAMINEITIDADGNAKGIKSMEGL